MTISLTDDTFQSVSFFSLTSVSSPPVSARTEEAVIDCSLRTES